MAGSGKDNNGGSLERLLLPEDAAKILNLSTSWLAKARVDGNGPAFVKIGRAVRYREASLRTSSELPEQTRRHWATSLRQIAKALDRPLAVIPARYSAVRADLVGIVLVSTRAIPTKIPTNCLDANN
jgi:hypothetical protein